MCVCVYPTVQEASCVPPARPRLVSSPSSPSACPACRSVTQNPSAAILAPDALLFLSWRLGLAPPHPERIHFPYHARALAPNGKTAFAECLRCSEQQNSTLGVNNSLPLRPGESSGSIRGRSYFPVFGANLLVRHEGPVSTFFLPFRFFWYPFRPW